MAKKNQTRNVVLGTLGILVMLLLLVNSSNLGLNLPLFSIGGADFTVTSISATKVISNDKDVESANFLVNVYSGGGNQIIGAINPSTFESKSGYETENSLVFSMTPLDEKLEAKIENTGQEIIKYDYIRKEASNSCSSANFFKPSDAPLCPIGSSELTAINSYGVFGGQYICERQCFTPKVVGVIGNIKPTNVKDTATITLKVGDEQISQTISQDNPSADFISSSKGYVANVKFPASGWTGNVLPPVNNLRAYFDTGTNMWKITSLTNIIEYQSGKKDFDNWAKSLQTISFSGTKEQQIEKMRAESQNRVGDINGIVEDIRNDDLSITQSEVWGNRNDKNNGKLIVNLDRQLAVANYVFLVKASWLGVKIPVGDPKINSVSCSPFKSGDEGIVTASIFNKGDADGTFTYSLSCNTIKQSFINQYITIPSKKSSNVQFKVDAGSFAGAITDSCNLIVADFNKPSNKDTSSFSCKVEPPAECQEGSIKSVGNSIKKCEGGKLVTIQDCSSTQIITRDVITGQYSCKDKSSDTQEICNDGFDNDNDGKVDKSDEECNTKCDWYNLSCQFSLLGNLLLYLRYTLLAVVTLLSLFLSKQFIDKLVRNNPIAVWSIASLLTLAVGIILYITLITIVFWYLAIGTIILLIFLNFVPIGRAIKRRL